MHQPILIQIIIWESRARNDIPSPINETDIPVLKKMYHDTIFCPKIPEYCSYCAALIFIA